MSSVDWKPWKHDPVAEATGITFDRSPVDAGRLRAPPSKVRLCAWHIDFDERPVCFVDLDSLDEAVGVAKKLRRNCSFNVDFTSAYDEHGAMVHSDRPW